MAEMLRNISVVKPNYEETKTKLREDLIIHHGKFDVESYIKKDAIEKRRELEAGKKLAIIEEQYFNDNFEALQMIITTKALNNNGKIKVKNNQVFYQQLEVLSRLGFHKVESMDKKEIMLFNFIQNPTYEKGLSYMRFYISKPVAKMLIDLTKGYSQVNKKLLYENSSPDVLNLYLFLKRKFGKTNGGSISIDVFLETLNLSNVYRQKIYRLKNWLNKIRKELDAKSTFSFNYEIVDNKINFTIYEARESIEINYNNNESDYQKSNALKYIFKTRKLTEQQKKALRRIFENSTYKKLSKITRTKLDKSIVGQEYFNWFIEKFNETDIF